MKETDNHIKVTILSASARSGGAAIAALRLHRALLRSGTDSSMLVKHSNIVEQGVQEAIKGGSGKVTSRMVSLFEAVINKLLFKRNPIMHSTGLFGLFDSKSINRSEADIINLHWINDGFLSIRQISKIDKPVIWTLHDAWPFSGAEHYPNGINDLSFKSDYIHVKGISGFLNRWCQRLKKHYWKKPLILVTPSKWLAELARQSPVANGWPVYTLPNPLDTQIYAPTSESGARKNRSVPEDKILILSGAYSGAADPRKGFDLLCDALSVIKETNSAVFRTLHLVMLGQKERPEGLPEGLDVTCTGHLSSDREIAGWFSVSDMTVLPSRMDNLPQIGTESLACGTPVIAFSVGGIPEIVEDGQTGLLVPPFDTKALAMSIETLATDSELRQRLATNGRAKAVREWSEEVVASRYNALYAEVAKRHRTQANIQ